MPPQFSPGENQALLRPFSIQPSAAPLQLPVLIWALIPLHPSLGPHEEHLSQSQEVFVWFPKTDLEGWTLMNSLLQGFLSTVKKKTDENFIVGLHFSSFKRIFLWGGSCKLYTVQSPQSLSHPGIHICIVNTSWKIAYLKWFGNI